MEQGAFMVSISCCVQLLPFILVLHGGSKPLKCLKPSYHLKKDYPLKLMKTYLFRFISSSFRIYNIIKSKPTQTDTTLLDVICCVHLHTLLHVVGNSVAQSLKPVKLLATCKQRQQLPTLLGQQSRELLHPFARIALQSTYRSTTLSTSMFYLFITRKPPKLKQHIRNKFNDKVYQKF